ncbi:MAG: magnesium transporter, partial [Atribacterota bacterium]|nr:magnesium transporter [Atribacterota bacterium]
LPLVFTKLNIDPAVATGPFITTAVDVGSLIIYFSLGTYLFTHLGNI